MHSGRVLVKQNGGRGGGLMIPQSITDQSSQRSVFYSYRFFQTITHIEVEREREIDFGLELDVNIW